MSSRKTSQDDLFGGREVKYESTKGENKGHEERVYQSAEMRAEAEKNNNNYPHATYWGSTEQWHISNGPTKSDRVLHDNRTESEKNREEYSTQDWWLQK